MGFEMHIEKKNDYLHVKYTGAMTIADIPMNDDFFQPITTRCKQNECHKALLDARDLTVKFSTFDKLDIGTKFAESPFRGIRFALLGTNEQNSWDQGFLENVAVNRGAVVKVFTDEKEAVEWLSMD